MGKPNAGSTSPPLTEKEKRRREEEKRARLNNPERINIVERSFDIPEVFRAEICCYCGKIIGWSGYWFAPGSYGPPDRRLNGFGFAEHQNCQPCRAPNTLDHVEYCSICKNTKHLTNGEFYKNLEKSISRLKTPTGFIVRQIRKAFFLL